MYREVQVICVVQVAFLLEEELSIAQGAQGSESLASLGERVPPPF